MCSTVRSSMVQRQPRVARRGRTASRRGRACVSRGCSTPPCTACEQREQPVPGGGGVLQVLLASPRRALLQLGAEPAGRVRLRVELVVGGQQPAFLGEEQEHDAHHHRDRAAVDLVRGRRRAGRARRVAVADVGPADRGDQQLDRLADLDAERLGDLLLAVQAALRSSGTRRSSSGTPKKRLRRSSERNARTTSRSAASGQATASNIAVDGDAAARRPDQRPPAAVGGQAELDVVVAAQLRDPVGRGRRPAEPRDPGGGLLPRRADQAEQPHGCRA